MIDTCWHGRKICSECYIADDAAKRAYDQVRLHVEVASWDDRVQGEPYVAVRLSDGGTDGHRYATKQAAVRAQLHEQQCAYFSFKHSPMGFANYREAGLFLEFHRMAYNNGFRLPDPDDTTGGPDLIMPSSNEHLQNQLNRLAN